MATGPVAAWDKKESPLVDDISPLDFSGREVVVALARDEPLEGVVDCSCGR